MNLISCYIAGFGGLSNRSFTFSSGLNVIYGENGWGKSTLAAFIRVMFYGMDGNGKHRLNENERKHYRPWQGGIYGGKIVYCFNGRQYTLTRTFGDKESQDTIELRETETNLFCETPRQELGKILFGIDRASFSRSVFIEQVDRSFRATDDIHAKIGQIIDNGNDMNNFETADRRLSSILNALNPNHASSSVSKRKREIALLEGKLDRDFNLYQKLSEAENVLQELYELKSSLSEDIAACRLNLKEANTAAINAQQIAEYDRTQLRLKKSAAELSAAESCFPETVPEVDEIRQILRKCNDSELLLEKIQLYTFNQEEKNEFERLSCVFPDGGPDDATLEKISCLAGEISDIEAGIEKNTSSSKETDRLAMLTDRFGSSSVSPAEISRLWDLRKQASAAAAADQMAIRSITAGPASNHLKLFLICAVLCIFCGSLLFYFYTTTLAAIFFLAAGVIPVSLLLKIRKNQVENKSDQISVLRKNLEENIAFIADADKQITDFLRYHGYPFEEASVSSALTQISIDYADFIALKECGNKRSPDDLAVSPLKEEFAALIRPYGIKSTSDCYAAVLQLRTDVEHFRALNEKRKKYDIFVQSNAGLLDDIHHFCLAYGFEIEQDPKGQMQFLMESAIHYYEALETHNSNLLELNSIQIDQTSGSKLTDLPSVTELEIRLDDLLSASEQNHAAIKESEKSLDLLRQRCDELDMMHTRLNELKALQNKDLEKYRLVSIARDGLRSAKQGITARFSSPILNRFLHYYRIIFPMDRSVFMIDANIAVTEEVSGIQRGTETMSTGQNDLIDCCLRMALADIMYPAEKPPLILDDPFTNLDDGKHEGIKNFLHAVADDYQVIYFTCSQSRI